MLKLPSPIKDDFGIAVAILMPQRFENAFNTKLQSTLPITPSNITHLTDIKPQLQQTCREIVYKAAKAFQDNLCIVYEAIPAKGFHEVEYTNLEPAFKQFTASQKNAIIKQTVRMDNPSAHAELLLGAILKARAAVKDCYKSNSAELDCKLDEVDDSILKEVKICLKDFDACNGSDDVKGFKIATKQHLSRTIKWNIGLPPNDLCPVNNISRVSKSSCSVFAADIIANALYHHLQEHVANFGLECLNQEPAIKGFKFEEFIIPSTQNDFSDILYVH